MGWDHKQSLKEVVRHLLFTLGAQGLLDRWKARRGYSTSHLASATAREAFVEAYRSGGWVHAERQESRSGLGSELASTRELVERLPSLLRELGCGRLLDVGCGDWNWMRTVELPCEYVGIDIVPEVIEANRRFERPGVRFLLADASAEELPEADVVLCREVLFHLSFADGLAMLAKARRAGKWLIATTDATIWFNSDIRTGDFRKLNLERAPYRLPAPRERIADGSVYWGRRLGVWKSEDIPIGTSSPPR